MNDRESFATLVAALAPWAPQLVFVGGWAHRLHRLHPSADPPAYQPLATLDADVAFAERAQLEGSIRARLQEAGFTQQLTGDHRPPVSQYTLGEDANSGFYAELLTPLTGRATTREGVPIATVENAGITAQRLRYLELLLHAPWHVTLTEEWGIRPLVDVCIPNPVSFIVQKLLIHADRPREKRSQDILYIHDTLQLFSADIGRLAAIWNDDVQPGMHANWVANVYQTTDLLFGRVSDPIRDAAVIPQDRELDPERVQTFCHAALLEILAPAASG